MNFWTLIGVTREGLREFESAFWGHTKDQLSVSRGMDHRRNSMNKKGAATPLLMQS